MGRSTKIKKLRRRFRKEHGRDPHGAGLFMWSGVFNWHERIRWHVAQALVTDRIKAQVKSYVPLQFFDQLRFDLAARILGRAMLAKIREHLPIVAKDEFRQYKKEHL